MHVGYLQELDSCLPLDFCYVGPPAGHLETSFWGGGRLCGRAPFSKEGAAVGAEPWIAIEAMTDVVSIT